MSLPHSESYRKPNKYRPISSGTLNFHDTKQGATVSGTIAFGSDNITVTIETIEKSGLAVFATKNFIVKKAMETIVKALL